MNVLNKLVAAALMTLVAGISTAARAEQVAPPKARNVVLVHGAYADGSSWSEVIPLLQKAGLHVTSVQNPLTSFADDVDATKRVLALQDGPTVLVGHSYAGMVISETGNDPKVSSLVYVAARAPDAGEDYPSLGISLAICRPTRRARSTPYRAAFPISCSRQRPRRRPGTTSRHSMRCRGTTRPPHPISSASSPSGCTRPPSSSTPATSR